MSTLKSTVLAGAVAAALTAGCATTPPSPGTPVAPDAEVMAKIASYAQTSSQSMQRLASLRGANGGVQVADMTIPPGLDAPISINWTGPVDSLVRKIAEMSGYTYAGVIGSRPATPVLVSVAVTNTPAFNILADAGAQAGSAADIVVRPESRQILVKYPPVVQSGGFVNKSK